MERPKIDFTKYCKEGWKACIVVWWHCLIHLHREGRVYHRNGKKYHFCADCFGVVNMFKEMGK